MLLGLRHAVTDDVSDALEGARAICALLPVETLNCFVRYQIVPTLCWGKGRCAILC